MGLTRQSWDKDRIYEHMLFIKETVHVIMAGHYTPSGHQSI